MAVYTHIYICTYLGNVVYDFFFEIRMCVCWYIYIYIYASMGSIWA